jgi:hypothetical protein
MSLIHASLLTHDHERLLQNELAILDGLSETHKVVLPGPFAMVSSAWALHELVSEPHDGLTVLEVGSPASLLALALADKGNRIAVVNEKFHGEFLSGATQKDVTVFPRPISVPWSKFFREIADAVVCFNIDDLVTSEMPLYQVMRHLLVPVRPGGGVLLATARVRLAPDAMVGLEVDGLEGVLEYVTGVVDTSGMKQMVDTRGLKAKNCWRARGGFGCALIRVYKP